MPTPSNGVIVSIGSRAADSVTVNSVTSTTVAGYSNAWSVVLSAAVPSTTKIGDKLTTGANSYLITNIVSSTLTVVGDVGIAFSSTSTPSTGSATTARSYSTPPLFASGAPASLVSKDWIWRGEIYKEGGGTNNEWQISSTSFNFSSTTDSTRYFVLTTASGQSFLDNANKLTNALNYAPANGVAINLQDSTSRLTVSLNVTVYISNIQFTSSANTFYSVNGALLRVDFCIIKTTSSVFNDAGAFVSTNCLIISPLPAYSGGSSNVRFYNCTMYGNNHVVYPGASSTVIKNCAFFGYPNFTVNTINTTDSTNNCTSLASLGFTNATNLLSRSAANQFQSLTGGSEDFRIKAGAGVINAGIRDQTNTNDLDIVGSARSTTTPTIGAWEFASITYTYARPASDITTQWSTSSGSTHYTLIDETVADDNDYIVATAAGQTDEVKLASMTPPQVGTNLVINYKVAGIDGGATVTVSLREGSAGTLIKTDTAKSANGTYALTVAPADWAAVSAWSDLRLRFVSA